MAECNTYNICTNYQKYIPEADATDASRRDVQIPEDDFS